MLYEEDQNKVYCKLLKVFGYFSIDSCFFINFGVQPLQPQSCCEKIIKGFLLIYIFQVPFCGDLLPPGGECP